MKVWVDGRSIAEMADMNIIKEYPRYLGNRFKSSMNPRERRPARSKMALMERRKLASVLGRPMCLAWDGRKKRQ